MKSFIFIISFMWIPNIMAMELTDQERDALYVGVEKLDDPDGEQFAQLARNYEIYEYDYQLPFELESGDQSFRLRGRFFDEEEMRLQNRLYFIDHKYAKPQHVNQFIAVVHEIKNKNEHTIKVVVSPDGGTILYRNENTTYRIYKPQVDTTKLDHK